MHYAYPNIGVSLKYLVQVLSAIESIILCSFLSELRALFEQMHYFNPSLWSDIVVYLFSDSVLRAYFLDQKPRAKLCIFFLNMVGTFPSCAIPIIAQPEIECG